MLILTGCSSMKTYRVVNQVIAPPYQLPETTKQLVILNANSTPVAHNTPNGQTVAVDESYLDSKYLIDRFYSKLNLGKYYLVKKVNWTPNSRIWEDGYAKEYMTPNDVLIVLEDFESDYDFKSEKIRKHQLDPQGKDYYIEAYESTRNYRIKAVWSLYNGQNGSLLDRFEDIGEKKFATQGLQKDQTIIKLDSLGKGVPHYIMDSLALSLTNYIMPIRIYDTWTYFAKGSDALEKGSKYFALEKLDDAEDIYHRSLSSADDKTKPKLYYNLAVIADIKRNYQQALDYAENAVLLSDKSVYKTLFNKIKLKLEIESR